MLESTIVHETANEKVVSTALDPHMKIKKNYERAKLQDPDEGKTQKCFKCGQEIPKS